MAQSPAYPQAGIPSPYPEQDSNWPGGEKGGFVRAEIAGPGNLGWSGRPAPDAFAENPDPGYRPFSNVRPGGR